MELPRNLPYFLHVLYFMIFMTTSYPWYSIFELANACLSGLRSAWRLVQQRCMALRSRFLQVRGATFRRFDVAKGLGKLTGASWFQARCCMMLMLYVFFFRVVLEVRGRHIQVALHSAWLGSSDPKVSEFCMASRIGRKKAAPSFAAWTCSWGMCEKIEKWLDNSKRTLSPKRGQKRSSKLKEQKVEAGDLDPSIFKNL